MTVWVLQQKLSAEDEANIESREYVRLPLDGVPDLSRVTSPQYLRQVLYAMEPDAPPETIQRKIDRIWPRYSGLQKEDIIAVPLPHSGKVALAEVTGKYAYRVGDAGQDEHLIPVKWHKIFSRNALHKHKELLVQTEPMIEIENSQARIAIRDQLPHSYNRFARWKWLLVLFFTIMGIVRLYMRLRHRY